jgi:hypothetical protein
MASRIAIQAKLVMPRLKAPDTSRIIAIKPTAPAIAPSARAMFLFGIHSLDLGAVSDGHRTGG